MPYYFRRVYKIVTLAIICQTGHTPILDDQARRRIHNEVELVSLRSGLPPPYLCIRYVFVDVIVGNFGSCAVRTWRCSVGEHTMSCNSCRWFILDQTGSLQGTLGVSRGFLAANVPGIGSGWQQSKQNWALPAVVGK